MSSSALSDQTSVSRVEQTSEVSPANSSHSPAQAAVVSKSADPRSLNMHKRGIAIIVGIVLVGAALTAVMASEQSRALVQQLMGNQNVTQLTDTTQSDDVEVAATNTGTATPSVSEAETEQGSLFEGRLELLTENLLLFKHTESDQLNGIPNQFTYYQAGTFMTGEYAGYTRVIAIRPPEGPSDPEVFVLATKDFKSYVLDDPEGLTTQHALDDWQNPFSYLDRQKVIKTAVLPSEFSSTLSLNAAHTLAFRSVPTKYIETKQKDANGNQLSQVVIKQPDSTSRLLKSPFQHLQVFNTPFVQDMTYLKQLDGARQQEAQIKARYMTSSTVVTVVDSVGLPALYAQTTPSNITAYNQAKAQFDREYQVYQQQLERYEQDDSLPYPTYPQYVLPPSLGFQVNQLKIDSSSIAVNTLFKEYQTAIPGACALSQDTYTFELKDNELERVGEVGSLEIYKLKDNNHPLYQLAYSNKMSYFTEFPEEWEMVNEGMPRYSLEEYVARHPLFFFKNYWQEWVGVGEFDINLPGGCGKPVIYLYPEEPTNISVRFDTSVQLTTQIPQYQDGWYVLAQPNGMLTDISDNHGSCERYTTNHFGAEYAKHACAQNQYPYLYWAGNVRAAGLPKPAGGWVVSRNQLAEFLAAKLTLMGLNQIERQDFLSYWVPMMQRQQAPYYQLGFLQTRELGVLFPMVVTPQPDTIFRILLDYTPLQSMPDQLPAPQELERVERTGFTLIEWGGVKK